MDERTASESTHDLLLALAGRVDDDMLGWARELVAVGDDARAVELLTATLVAERTRLPVEVRAALVAAGQVARVDLDPAALAPASTEQSTEHRFETSPSGVADVAAAVRALSARHLRDCHVLLAWRLTPAGSAPGPLPHPVLLVEVEPGRQPSDVLAYQLAVALGRAGINASVEVFTSGHPLPAYQSSALRGALSVLLDGGQEGRSPLADPPAPARPEPLRSVEPPESVPFGEPRAAEPEQHDVFDAPSLPTRVRRSDRWSRKPFQLPELEDAAPEPEGPEDPGAASSPPVRGGPAMAPSHPLVRSVFDNGGRRRRSNPSDDVAPEPAPRPTPRTITGPSRRPGATPISRTTLPEPVPLVRREGRPRSVHPLAPIPARVPELVAEPVDEPIDAPDVEEAGAAPDLPTPELPARVIPEPVEEPIAASADGPALTALRDPLSDPLSDPVSQPLLAPLLDPTIHDNDPLGLDDVETSTELTLAEPVIEEHTADEERAELDIAPRADVAAEPETNEAGWAAEWTSGAWAMSPSDEVEHSVSEDPDDAFPAPGGAEDEPETIDTLNERHARHRFAEEERESASEPHPTLRPEAVDEPGFDEVEPHPEEAGHRSSGTPLGLRPESLARLSDADRELLARLQAELIAGRKPRVSRRAGPGGLPPHTNGSSANGSPGTNGHSGPPRRSEPPPDLAG